VNDRERRRFDRLPIAIPLFVRGADKEGKKFLDFTVAINMSAGGALVASRRSLSPTSWLSLEIPAAPIPALQLDPGLKRAISARVLRSFAKDAFTLYAVRFVPPLVSSGRKAEKRHARAVVTSVA